MCWIWSSFQKCSKKFRKSFFFFFWLDNCILIGCAKFSLLRREYWSSEINMLTSSSKILSITQKDIQELIFIHIDQKICKRGCCADLGSVWDHFACCFWKGLVKRAFLDTHLTKSFAVSNFGNTWPIRVIFFSKCSKFDLDF